MSRVSRQTVLWGVILIGGLVLAAMVPYFYADSPFWVTVGSSVCVFAILGLSYNLLLGHIGLFSFGHALFFGFSAYILANLTLSGAGILTGAVLAVVGNVVLAAFIGLVTLRVSGIYFAIVTLAFAQAAFTASERDVFGLTGGENGRRVEDLPRWLNVNLFPENIYWISLALLVVSILVLFVLRRSVLGKVWDAIRENPLRAESLGINIRAHRVLAFAVSGALAGIAGVIYAISLQYATPNELGLDITVQALLITIIGGPGTLLGPVLGAIFVRVSEPLIDEYAGLATIQSLPDVIERMVTSHPLILGLIYILLVLFLPGGLASLGERLGPARRALLGPGKPPPGYEPGDRGEAVTTMGAPAAEVPKGGVGLADEERPASEAQQEVTPRDSS